MKLLHDDFKKVIFALMHNCTYDKCIDIRSQHSNVILISFPISAYPHTESSGYVPRRLQMDSDSSDCRTNVGIYEFLH